jgi:hypothetical protein
VKNGITAVQGCNVVPQGIGIKYLYIGVVIAHSVALPFGL